LGRSMCLLYTPSNEHFGIVPLEAAIMGTPVLACDSGGPLETICDEQTGFLRPPDENEWSKCLFTLCSDQTRAIQMGENGKGWVVNFSREKQVEKLNSIFQLMLEEERKL